MGRWTGDLQIRTTEAAVADAHRPRDSDNKYPFLRAPGAGFPRSSRQQIRCLVYIRLPLFHPHTAFPQYMLFIRVLIIRKASLATSSTHSHLANALPPNPWAPGAPERQGEFGVQAGSKHCVHSGRLDTRRRTLMAPQPGVCKMTLRQNSKARTFSNKAKNLPF